MKTFIKLAIILIAGLYVTACGGGDRDAGTSSTAAKAPRAAKEQSDKIEVIGKITATINSATTNSDRPTIWYITNKYYSASSIWQCASAFTKHANSTAFTFFAHNTPDTAVRDERRALKISAQLGRVLTATGSKAAYQTEITLGLDAGSIEELYYAPNSRTSIKVTKFAVEDGVAHITGSFTAELRQDKTLGGIINITDGQFDVKLGEIK